MQSKDAQHPRRRLRCFGWAILVMYSLLLVYLVRCRTMGSGTPPLLWQLRDPGWMAGWIGALVLGAFLRFGYFVPVGFGAALLVPAAQGRLRRLSRSLPALGVGSALTTLVCAAGIGGPWRLTAVIAPALPLLGCCFGVWAGIAWLRGRRSRLWFLPKAALLALLPTLAAGIALWLSLEDAPLPFEAAPVTAHEKQRLVRMVRNKSPGSLETNQTHTLGLTEQDINLLLSWGLSCEPPNRKAALRLGRDSIALSMSLPVPLGEGRLRHLNLEITGDAKIEEGILRLRVDRCRVGHVTFHRRLLHCLGPLVASQLNHDRQMKPFLHAVREMAVEPDSIRLTYGRLDLPPEFRRQFLHPSIADEELLVSTRTQVDHLLLLLTASPSPDLLPDFNLCLKTAFALARDRSARGNPVQENQAAIFALGILLGHPGIEEFMGSVMDSSDWDAAQQILHRVLVRGRSDWTRHFCVSAVIATLSDRILSDAVGLLKEELDTEEDGSGFSFADLLADRTGTTFALAATRDEPTARTMQDRLARGVDIADIFPAADGLPEGIPDAELQSRYGGVGGEGYRSLTAEIERRIAACRAYRTDPCQYDVEP